MKSSISPLLQFHAPRFTHFEETPVMLYSFELYHFFELPCHQFKIGLSIKLWKPAVPIHVFRIMYDFEPYILINEPFLILPATVGSAASTAGYHPFTRDTGAPTLACYKGKTHASAQGPPYP